MRQLGRQAGGGTTRTSARSTTSSPGSRTSSSPAQYIADTKGYYKAAGFSQVNSSAGGPTVQQDAAWSRGKALVGISSPDITGAAILKGAPLKIIGAQYQKNPFCIMSLAEQPDQRRPRT